ncbi:3-deoxy-D-manno-octulosonate 8-phosphate phosphatase (KDO 8-P phosphatase) [Pseudoduganella lurida]|uniref:3-deoxy-D-manno-octulosonate 8-phosphate phosphatase KdsC n=1 Tax=Pseudoduganella lurida TaxID=1036180 RepID=A0A562QVL7_9BURK|nr:HAD-IIIA family hydrolase [Pseudoduganella lurida]TWI60807.1 3-deoxy-D-manno-octulosonate 8-phosphate phosphatase (KDO 8-P phosphatase) [Pseudoduganella lurida]
MAAQFDVQNLERAAKVKLFIFDVDGVLTDGSLHYGAEGEAFKTFNVHDGLGIKLLQESGVLTSIISARRSPQVTARAKDLAIEFVHQGGHDKLTPFKALLAQLNLSEEQVAFIGDDVVDIPILSRVGFAIGVPNGRPEVLSRVHHVTAHAGGRGAVREACEFVMRAQGTYDRVLTQFLG